MTDKMSAMDDLPPVNAGDWGVVLVLKGKHRGKTGYYDDDATEKSAIVYFGIPFVDPYYVIPRSFMRRTPNAPLLTLEKFIRERPDIAKQLGIER